MRGGEGQCRAAARGRQGSGDGDGDGSVFHAARCGGGGGLWRLEVAVQSPKRGFAAASSATGGAAPIPPPTRFCPQPHVLGRCAAMVGVFPTGLARGLAARVVPTMLADGRTHVPWLALVRV